MFNDIIFLGQVIYKQLALGFSPDLLHSYHP